MLLSKVPCAWLCRGVVAGVGHRHRAVGDLPAVQALGQGLGTVSSTALKNAYGIDPSSTSRPKRDPGADRRRVHAQADRGQERVRAPPRSARRAAPEPTGRSMQIVVVSRNVTSRPYSLGQGGLDDLLLHLAVQRHGVVLPQVDQRVLLGQLRPARRAARPGRDRRTGSTTVSRLGGAKCSRVARPAARRSGRRSGPPARPRSMRDLAGAAPPAAARCSPAVEDAASAVTLSSPDRARRTAHGAGEHPHVGDLLAGRAALHLEHRAGGRAAGSPRRRQQRR